MTLDLHEFLRRAMIITGGNKFWSGICKMHQLDIHCGQSKLIVTIKPILCQWIWLVSEYFNESDWTI